LAVLGASLDQITKYWVFYWLENSTYFQEQGRGGVGSREVVSGKFRLYTQYWTDADDVRHPQVNHGALFGLGNKHEGAANLIFAAVSIFAGVAIVVWSFRRKAPGDRLLCAALGLILAGTMGNLYDRLVFHGVRDFLYWYGYGIDWPVFNVADCCLVCGAFLLLAQAFFAKPVAETQPVNASVLAQPVPAPEMARIN
jgi:signal peptidase II